MILLNLQNYWADKIFPRLFLFLLLSFCCAGTLEAEWFADAKAGTLYEDNLTRSFDDSDMKQDIAFIPAVSAGYYYQLLDSAGLSTAVEIRSASYRKYSGLDNVYYGLSSALKYKMGMGAYAPWLRMYGLVSGNNYREGMRDSAVFGSGFYAGKRFLEQLSLQTGYDYEAKNAKDTVFNQRSHRWSVKADYSATSVIGLSLGCAYRYGDVIIYYSPAEEEEDAPILNTFNTPMEAENYRATTYSLLLGVNLSLTKNFYVDLGYEHQQTNTAGRSYPDNLLKGSVGYSY